MGGAGEQVLWSLPEGERVRALEPFSTCAFSPDGRWRAGVAGRELRIEETRSGRLWLRQELDALPSQLAWRPQGNRLALADTSGAVWLADLPPEGVDEPLRMAPLEGHGSTVVFLQFTPDGTALVSTGWDGFTLFWDALTGRRLLTESRQLLEGFGGEPPQAVALRPLPHRATLARVWPREAYRVVAALPVRPHPPVGLALSADGRWLAVDNARFVTLFDAATGRELARWPGVSPEFAATGDALWTCEGERVLRFHAAKAGGPDFDPAGEIFFRTAPGTRANSVSLAPDGETLLVCAADRAVVMLDAATGDVRREVAVPAHYARLAADGETLVTQFHNGAAHLVRLGATNAVTLMGTHLNTRFGPGGRWLGLATEQMLALFERNETNRYTRRQVLELAGGAGAPATFAFAPGGELVAVVFNRFDVRLYEPDSGRLLAALSAPFPAQISGVNGLAFSADGRELFAAKQDGEIVAWDLPGLRQGLDWVDSPGVATGGAKSPSPSPGPVLSVSDVTAVSSGRLPGGAGGLPVPPAAGGGLWAPLAVTAGAAACLAGVVVFALQRRMLAAYERAATLAEARQRSLVETQLALAQSQKLEALGTLAAGIAHDFNNLLSVIRMSNHFVARAAPADAITRENLAAIEEAVARGRDLVRSMLGYVRRTDDEAGAFSVARVVGDTMGMLSRQFLSGLTLSLELDSACPPVAGSAARLEQMLLNLVVNAAEAMQGNGSLTVAARVVPGAPAGVLAPASSGPCVELSVQDTGPGIAPAHLPRVFEPFFTTKHGGAQPGTGLGLSVVYTLARQSGWGLDVASQPGVGTAFRVYLPVGDPGPGNHPTSVGECGRAR